MLLFCALKLRSTFHSARGSGVSILCQFVAIRVIYTYSRTWFFWSHLLIAIPQPSSFGSQSQLSAQVKYVFFSFHVIRENLVSKLSNLLSQTEAHSKTFLPDRVQATLINQPNYVPSLREYDYVKQKKKMTYWSTWNNSNLFSSLVEFKIPGISPMQEQYCTCFLIS